jgi:regulator of RNase E activity RraB
MNVALRPEASSDLVSAAEYFNDVNDGWGDHFLDTASYAHDDFGEIIVWATLEKDS